jgi:methyltransferase (TIGR00027 family)
MIDPRSVSAFMSAFTRAHHALHDSPRIFDDTWARRFFSDTEFAEFECNLTVALAFFDPESAARQPPPAEALALTMRAMGGPITISRARYAEDLLQARLGETGQYVILGAGLDTFCWRRADLLPNLEVFEVDHPVTQAEKFRRVREGGWGEPERLHLVPIDFGREPLGAALTQAGFRSDVPALFNWLGVTYYLSRRVVLDTLAEIATASAPGTRVVFDFFDALAFTPGRIAPRMQRMQAATQRSGHPMITGFEPGALRGELEARGLALEEALTPEEIQARCFAGRTDGLRAFEHVHFAVARVRAR